MCATLILVNRSAMLLFEIFRTVGMAERSAAAREVEVGQRTRTCSGGVPALAIESRVEVPSLRARNFLIKSLRARNFYYNYYATSPRPCL